MKKSCADVSCRPLASANENKQTIVDTDQWFVSKPEPRNSESAMPGYPRNYQQRQAFRYLRLE
jgi:hypothetical protein